MDSGIFTDSTSRPVAEELRESLGSTYKFWDDIKDYAMEQSLSLSEEWNYSKSFGWSCRLRDKKRVIVYLLPLAGKFRASFVFGEKATSYAMTGKISKDITDLISSARVYAEGRGFRILVENKKIVKDIKKLIDIKLAN